MIWDEADQQAMRRIFGQVWVAMRLAPPHPLHTHPHPRHSSALVRPPHPVARSWLGVGGPTPNHTLTSTHTRSLKGLTMRKRSLLTIPVAALAVITLGLTVGATLPEPGVGTPTPAASAPFTLPPVLAAAVQCEEDEPCWDCETMGNHICSGTELPEDLKRSAWKAWDAAGGAAQLLVNPHARVTLTGYSVTDPYRQGAPELDIHQLALHDSGIWYVFTAEAI